MPIYEFTCQSCGNEFEKLQSFSATVAPPCPSCKGEQVVRRLSRPAIHFKGSGWYITDSKTENKTNGKGGTKSDGETSTSETTAGESSTTDTTAKSEKSETPAKEATSAPAEKAKESVA